MKTGLEEWQPAFRFLEKWGDSEFIGLAFAIVFLIVLVAGWYWICFKNGAEKWRARIILPNRRLLGVNSEWITPFILKCFATLMLLGSLFGFVLVVLTKLKSCIQVQSPDRLIAYGAFTHTYSASGERETATEAGRTSTYTCHPLNNLAAVTLPPGRRWRTPRY